MFNESQQLQMTVSGLAFMRSVRMCIHIMKLQMMYEFTCCIYLHIYNLSAALREDVS